MSTPTTAQRIWYTIRPAVLSVASASIFIGTLVFIEHRWGTEGLWLLASAICILLLVIPTAILTIFKLTERWDDSKYLDIKKETL